MSFFRRVHQSTVGPLHRQTAVAGQSRTSSISRNVHHCNHHARQSPSSHVSTTLMHIEFKKWVIGALVQAGQCRKHSSGRKSAVFMTSQRPRVSRWKGRSNGTCPTYPGHSPQSMASSIATMTETATDGTTTIAQEEFLGLVDLYDDDSFTDRSSLSNPLDPFQDSPGPHLMISDKPEDVAWPPPEHLATAIGTQGKAVEELKQALEDRSTCPEHLYDLYRALPSPRVSFLSSRGRHRLLRRLGVVERKDEHSMLRYLSVIDDMKVNAIPLSVQEWNMATSFAGRYVSKTTEVEVEAGLRIFKEMEQLANVRANSATFNILFDMAAKAGKFHLGELIYKEMVNRGHAFNRFHHVSVIHYHGLREDGDSVRNAYKALVNAGEIVDTVVLNCLISSLIRAREPQSAMQVYERMKRLHSLKTNAPLPSRDYRRRRSVAKALIKMAHTAKKDPVKFETFSNDSIIAPDTQTFRILMQHVAVQAGELHGAAKLLDEMRWYQVPLSGSIFLSLFKGFAIHGGERYTHWTDARLQSVWRAYLLAIDKTGSDELYIGKWMIAWALRAFAKCSGKTRTQQIWNEVQLRWEGEEGELEHLRNLVLSLIKS